MNVLLWVLQVLAALLYAASGVMKVFMFEQVSRDVPSFGALPREAWTALGILELVCVVGLIVPAALHWRPALTAAAAAVLAAESLVFIGVHARYREVPTIVMCAVLGLVMAFIAYGRWVLRPIGWAWGSPERRRDGETKRWRDGETERRRDEETKRRRDGAGLRTARLRRVTRAMMRSRPGRYQSLRHGPAAGARRSARGWRRSGARGT